MEQLPAADPLNPKCMDAPNWKRRRDHAMLAMMLGAGLKVSEAIALRVDQVGEKDASGSIPIRIRKFSKKGVEAHETVLRVFAAKHVLPWIAERKMHAIPSKLLFPVTLSSDEALNKATVYRHVKASFERAGLDVKRLGWRTLHNSFAARELASQTDPALVKQFMGHHELRSTEKYRLITPQESLPG